MGVPRRVGALLLAGAVCAGEAAAQKKTDPPPDPEAAARLASAVAIREKQLELASGKGFYLILDPSQGTLRLFLKAAVLHTWKIEGIEVGAPRIAFVSRGLPRDWEGKVWTKGALDPARELDRYELVAPPPKPDGTETNIPIPPLPEEAFPVPPRYRVVFEGGLAIEVRPPSAGESAGFFARVASAIRIWWRDFVRAVSPAPDDRIRIRLVLDRDGADSLYRALPPDTALLVLPPGVAL